MNCITADNEVNVKQCYHKTTYTYFFLDIYTSCFRPLDLEIVLIFGKFNTQIKLWRLSILLLPSPPPNDTSEVHMNLGVRPHIFRLTVL